MKKVKNYIVESIDELRSRVSWPKLPDLQNSAMLVLVASMIFAILIGLIDFGFSNLMKLFYENI